MTLTEWLRPLFRQRVTVKYADPLHAGRHPFQTFLLVAGFVSSLPIVFDQPPAAQSIEALLPMWVGITWGLSLLGGCALGLAGSYWPRKSYATALTVERIGLSICGPAGVLYGGAIVLALGLDGLIAAALIFGFGAACISRAYDLGVIIKRAIPGDSLVVQREDEDAAEAMIRDDEDETT